MSELISASRTAKQLEIDKLTDALRQKKKELEKLIQLKNKTINSICVVKAEVNELNRGLNLLLQ